MRLLAALVALFLGLGPILLGVSLRARETFLGYSLMVFGASTLLILTATLINMRRRPRRRR